jgi:two-component system phosphate regulon response regulator PhoB
VTKPFSPRELIARVGAVLRRMRPALAGEQLAFGDTTWTSRRIARAARVIPCSSVRPSSACSAISWSIRAACYRASGCWTHDPDIDARTVDVHIRRLRKALNEGGHADVIRTVRSAGYSLDAEA